MAAGRFSSFPANATFVEAPEFTPAGGGLLDLADVRDVKSGDPALRGYTFETEINDVALGTVSGFVQSSTTAMAEGASHSYELSGDPFTVFGAAGVDSGAGDDLTTIAAKAQRRLELGEGLAAERALWETGGMLPLQASVPRAGAMRTKLAVGYLLEQWAAATNGTPYFWAGKRLSNEIGAQNLVEATAADAQVKGGGALINGAGFFAKTTIGGVTPTIDQVWLYASGTPVLYRSAVQVTSAHGASNSAGMNNRLLGFASRTYVPAIDGPVLAVLVDLTL